MEGWGWGVWQGDILHPTDTAHFSDLPAVCGGGMRGMVNIIAFVLSYRRCTPHMHNLLQLRCAYPENNQGCV